MKKPKKAIRVFKCSFTLSIHLLVVYIPLIFLFLKIHEPKSRKDVCVCLLENWTVSSFVPTMALERAENYNCWDSCRSM